MHLQAWNYEEKKKGKKLAIHAAPERLCTSLLFYKENFTSKQPTFETLSPSKVFIQINIDNKNGQEKAKRYLGNKSMTLHDHVF